MDRISLTRIRIVKPRRKAEEEAEEMPSEGIPSVKHVVEAVNQMKC